MSKPEKLLVLAVESSAARSAVAVLEAVASCQLPVARETTSGASCLLTTDNWQLTTLAVRDFPRGAGGVGAGSPAAAAEAALAEAGRKASEVNLVAVSVGPGSYTGLRIGVSFAKTFAWATGAAVVAVPSLVALAETAVASCQLAVASETTETVGNGVLVATADAFRGQLYARTFRREPSGALVDLTGDLVLSPVEFVCRLAKLRASSATANWQLATGNWLFGSGSSKHRAALEAAARAAGLAVSFSAEPDSPSVEAVGRIGIELFLAGKTVTAHDLVPVYLRKTEAEERAEARERQKS